MNFNYNSLGHTEIVLITKYRHVTARIQQPQSADDIILWWRVNCKWPLDDYNDYKTTWVAVEPSFTVGWFPLSNQRLPCCYYCLHLISFLSSPPILWLLSANLTRKCHFWCQIPLPFQLFPGPSLGSISIPSCPPSNINLLE